MSEQLEQQVESDVTEPSSEVQSSPAQQAAPEASQGAEGANEKSQETPFHEHPRFKELVEQKNRYAEEARALHQRLEQLEKQFSKPKEEAVDPVVAELKNVHPEFASRFEKLLAAQQKLEEMQSWRQQMEERQFRDTAVSTIRDLHSNHKVSPELAKMYEQQLDYMYMSGQIKSLDDIRGAYKTVHESYSQLLDSIKRSERESYVANKTQDAAKPRSAPKTAAPKAAKQTQVAKDGEDYKRMLTQQILAQARANSDI